MFLDLNDEWIVTVLWMYDYKQPMILLPKALLSSLLWPHNGDVFECSVPLIKGQSDFNILILDTWMNKCENHMLLFKEIEMVCSIGFLYTYVIIHMRYKHS